MKIVLDKEIYVQKKDLDFLISRMDEIPDTIIRKIFLPGQTIIDSCVKYDFVKFDDPSHIEFLNSIKWILDYSDVKDLNDDELIELRAAYGKERDALVKRYNLMCLAEKTGTLTDSEKEEKARVYDEFVGLSYKAQSVTTFLWYKQGDTEMVFPDGVEPTKPSDKGGQKVFGTMCDKKNW